MTNIVWPDWREATPWLLDFRDHLAVRLELREKRVAANGLEITRGYNTEDHFDAKTGEHTFTGTSVNDRTEAFIARVHTSKRLPFGHPVLRKGEDIVLWRIEQLHNEGWSDNRRVSYHGYANGGNQTVGFDSDEEAARHVTTLRNAAGKILAAKDHPKAEAWGERYSRMMSR